MADSNDVAIKCRYAAEVAAEDHDFDLSGTLIEAATEIERLRSVTQPDALPRWKPQITTSQIIAPDDEAKSALWAGLGICFALIGIGVCVYLLIRALE